MDDKLNIREFLSQLRNEEIVYVPNPGNAGDSLIAHATYNVFNSIGLSYVTGDLNTEYPGSCVIYGGGGNLVQPYFRASNFLKKNYKTAKKIIILPHSIRTSSELLSEFDDRVHIICRDKESLNFVKKYANKTHIYHSDDMAFHLDIKNLLEKGKEDFRSIFAIKKLIKRNIRRKVKALTYNFKNSPNPDRLNAFRTDLEKTDIEIPYSNIDLSEVFRTYDMSELFAYEASYKMVRFIDNYKEVHTNRLHVCIASALLGKQVFLYPNSYTKNLAVFEYSIDGKYENVDFVNKQ